MNSYRFILPHFKTNSIRNQKPEISLLHFKKVCQTSGGNDRGKALLKVVTENGFQSKDVYSIDETTYNINKKNSRSQGMLFRDDLCYECKFVETGVAYKIIFDKQKNILFNGFFIDTKQLDAILNCSN